MEQDNCRKPIEIPIMHCFDNNYVVPAAVSFYSMLMNADQQYFYRLFVLHSDITVQNQQKLIKLVRGFKNADLEFVSLNHLFNDVWDSMTNTDHLSKEVLYKLITPYIFKQYDRLIMTDVDVVFLGDIAPSYHVLDDHPDAYYAGVRQINPDKTFLRSYYEGYKKAFSPIEYEQLKVCGGYLVANLKKLREDEMPNVFISYLKNNSERLMQAEQDVINLCCRAKQIAMLPLNYVVCSYAYDICESPDITASDPYYTYKEMVDAMEHPIQLHYATKTKPWNTPDSTKAEIWYNYLKKTGFAEEFEKKKLYETAKTEAVPCRCMFPAAEGKAPVKISVLVCSYNHEKYIAETLQSILDQKTDYSYEIIVADDASTDKTQSIIRSFQKKYPEKMKKALLRTDNVGIGQNYYEALSLAEGEYLAFCDGDDRWCDESKLEKQIGFLEKNQEYTVACSDFFMHEEGKTSKKDNKFNVYGYLQKGPGKKKKYTICDLVRSRFIGSCTLVMRWKLRGRVPEFLKGYQVIDFPLELIHASCGYIKVFSEAMSVHNIHAKSITNSAKEEVLDDSIRLMAEVNQYLGYRITSLFKEYMQICKPPKAAVTAKQDDRAEQIVPDQVPVFVAATQAPTTYQRMERIYANCVPEVVKRIYRTIKRGVKCCYREIIPQGIRRKVSSYRNRSRNNG